MNNATHQEAVSTGTPLLVAWEDPMSLWFCSWLRISLFSIIGFIFHPFHNRVKPRISWRRGSWWSEAAVSLWGGVDTLPLFELPCLDSNYGAGIWVFGFEKFELGVYSGLKLHGSFQLQFHLIYADYEHKHMIHCIVDWFEWNDTIPY